MEWESPWGKGFPGWHIECSAMSAKYLGQPFDIHCGGIDHIPIHHTNEIAQSEAANGKPLANYWLHNEFINIAEDKKMAKSANNFITLKTMKDRGLSPIAYRYFLLQTHYRKQLLFSWEALQAAQNGLDHLHNIVRDWPEPKGNCPDYEAKFLDLVNNDLDTPNALALMWNLIKDESCPSSARKNTIFKFDKIFGLKLKEDGEKKEDLLPVEINVLVSERDEARKNKDLEKSDKIRKELEEKGYLVEDAKEKTKITKN